MPDAQIAEDVIFRGLIPPPQQAWIWINADARLAWIEWHWIHWMTIFEREGIPIWNGTKII